MAVICGICTNSINARRPAIFCSNCKKQFHTHCVSNKEELSNLLNDVRGLSWKCDDCVSTSITLNQDDIKAVIESQLQDAMANLKATFELYTADFLKSVQSNLQSILPKPSSSANSVAPSNNNYASVLRNKAQPAVIVRPKSHQECSITKADMMVNICPADSDIQFAKVKAVKDGGMLLGCRSVDDNNKLKRIVQQKMSDKYEVLEVRGINPRIRIVGITEKYDNARLLDLIKKCNRGIFSDSSSISLIKFCPIKKNQNLFQATLQVDKCTFESALAFGNIFVEFDCCKVFNAIDVSRCYNCNEFHHSSNNCKNSVLCPRCGGNHKVQDCKSSLLNCSNCVKLNAKLNGTVNAMHAAWDVNKCTAYKQACDRLRSDVLADR